MRILSCYYLVEFCVFAHLWVANFYIVNHGHSRIEKNGQTAKLNFTKLILNPNSAWMTTTLSSKYPAGYIAERTCIEEGKDFTTSTRWQKDPAWAIALDRNYHVVQFVVTLRKTRDLLHRFNQTNGYVTEDRPDIDNIANSSDLNQNCSYYHGLPTISHENITFACNRFGKYVFIVQKTSYGIYELCSFRVYSSNVLLQIFDESRNQLIAENSYVNANDKFKCVIKGSISDYFSSVFMTQICGPMTDTVECSPGFDCEIQLNPYESDQCDIRCDFNIKSKFKQYLDNEGLKILPAIVTVNVTGIEIFMSPERLSFYDLLIDENVTCYVVSKGLPIDLTLLSWQYQSPSTDVPVNMRETVLYNEEAHSSTVIIPAGSGASLAGLYTCLYNGTVSASVKVEFGVIENPFGS